VNQDEYDLAKSSYEVAIKSGVEDEFALAQVRFFQGVLCNLSDPIVVDMDGDGIELLPTHRGVNFDLYATTRKLATAWVQPDDAFLALDRNGNGIIDDGSELFGNSSSLYNDGFEQLRELDRPEMGGNSDGALTAADVAFNYLLLWQDRNTDGLTDPGELISVPGFGFISMPLGATQTRMHSGGNAITSLVRAMTTHGDVWMGDAFLHTAPHARLSRVD
jgi:hypothetical protein